DPMAEAIPMKMYTHYAVPRLLKYAKQFGINLYHDFVMPTFYEEFANRYFTAQKFIPNVTRSGDCSVILKVVPSERYLKSLLNRFEANPSMSQYANATVICATGQRNKEGSRRQTNMKAQGTSSKDIHQLVGELNSAEISTQYSLFLYAPIRDWTTEEVFTALELAGDKPLTRNLLGLRNPIPGFMSDFSLLLAIYGNASNEACEIAVGSKQSAGCNGKSRYGCLICPMVGTTDKTQTALSTLPRWQALLQEEALRVRDYMFRLSTRNDARMMHAKAFDPVGYSRIALQSNVLKVKYLEKLVRYSAQLSIESSRR
ncbi:phosphoadenosine phosphosulfate reductase, partial [Vibrio anguillarum]